MTKKDVIKQLEKAGHAKDKIKEIIKEAKESSNPEYIYHYWGVKNS